MDNRICVTTFCNQQHRISDGKPVDHCCFVMPTEALVAEQAGNVARATELLSAWKRRREHAGVRSKHAKPLVSPA